MKNDLIFSLIVTLNESIKKQKISPCAASPNPMETMKKFYLTFLRKYSANQFDETVKFILTFNCTHLLGNFFRVEQRRDRCRKDFFSFLHSLHAFHFDRLFSFSFSLLSAQGKSHIFRLNKIFINANFTAICLFLTATHRTYKRTGIPRTLSRECSNDSHTRLKHKKKLIITAKVVKVSTLEKFFFLKF